MPILTTNRIVLCASPSYLRQHGTPKTPEDLTQHNCLCLGHNDFLMNRWAFERNTESLTIEVSGNRQCKDGDAIRLWTIAGQGIAYKSRLDITKELNSGELVEIDTGWQGVKYPLYLLCAERRLLSPVVDALKKHLLASIHHTVMKRT